MRRTLRNLLVGVTAFSSVMLLGTPAANATKDFSWHQKSTSASASWLLADAYNTAVSVYAYSAVRNQFSGRPEQAGSSLVISVYQGYCDVANNEWVDRFWDGTTPAPVSVANDFTEASWPQVTVPLTGSETDTPLLGGACDSLDWENASTIALAPSTVTLAGAFTAAGPMVTENSSYRSTYDPYLWVTVTVARARMATQATMPTTVTDNRLAALESLPAPDFAYVGHTIRIELTVTRGHGHNLPSATR